MYFRHVKILALLHKSLVLCVERFKVIMSILATVNKKKCNCLLTHQQSYVGLTVILIVTWRCFIATKEHLVFKQAYDASYDTHLIQVSISTYLVPLNVNSIVIIEKCCENRLY